MSRTSESCVQPAGAVDTTFVSTAVDGGKLNNTVYSIAIDSSISQMDIVVNLEGHALEQVIAQLDKLINVISIKEILPNKAAPAVHDTQPDYQN